MVTGFMSLLQERYRGRLDAKADEYIGFASGAAGRMQRLIEDLLAYSRVGRGGSTAAADVGAAVVSAIDNLKVSIDTSGARLTCDALPTVQANPVELAQLFQNLIGNALKFRRPGVTPEVHVGARKISGHWSLGKGEEVISHRSLGSGQSSLAANDQEPMTNDLPQAPMANDLFWLFSVRDNGIGIPADQYQRIFEIFQRLHTREEYPGTGVGLAICKRIVERHGGRIWVESTVGEGTTFHFTLPG